MYTCITEETLNTCMYMTVRKSGNILIGLGVQFAMHFVLDCYTKLSGVATFSIVTYVP